MHGGAQAFVAAVNHFDASSYTIADSNVTVAAGTDAYLVYASGNNALRSGSHIAFLRSSFDLATTMTSGVLIANMDRNSSIVVA